MECLSSIPMFTALYTDETWNEIVDYWRVVEEAYRDEKFKLPHNEFPEGCSLCLFLSAVIATLTRFPC
jgi:MoCo/4Fe-4S cofactor protein with predicted Tat translocation signal